MGIDSVKQNLNINKLAIHFYITQRTINFYNWMTKQIQMCLIMKMSQKNNIINVSERVKERKLG
jgi:hypothetical protein